MSEASPSPFEQRLQADLAASPPLIPVVVGLCGSGRTTALRRVHERLGPGRCQYLDVERTATTPERFLQSLREASPFASSERERRGTPRGAFEATLAFLAGARCPSGEPATFLLDEVLEFRTFESFPGLRHALPQLLSTIADTPNRFILSSRFPGRAARAIEATPGPFVLTRMEALEARELERMMGRLDGAAGDAGALPANLAPVVRRICQGRPAIVRILIDTMGRAPGAAADPLAGLAEALASDGGVTGHCRFCYEFRLNRARGYGALKAILDILADEEPLTLTQIARRLSRTPGSTKDYLSWLEDVDLVAVDGRKRYGFRDPLLRLWVRLHCRACPPSAEEIAREVQAYAGVSFTPPG